MTTLQLSGLLDVPREVRDVIYRYYVQEEDGYHFDAHHIEHPPTVFSTSSVRADVNSELATPSATGSTFLEYAAHRRNYTIQQNLVHSRFLVSDLDPWIVASENVITGLEEILIDIEGQEPPEYLDFWKRTKWRFSAAAAAIFWLESMPAELRLQVRDLLLLEDHEPVAYPECHALGLIPFCIENPRLHIERKVSLWRTVLPRGCPVDLWYELNVDDSRARFGRPFDALDPRMIGESISVWIAEALALPAAGMPENAFSLVFDGHPDPEQSTGVFEFVKLDAAFQIVKDQQLERRPETYEDVGFYCADFARFDTFPQVIRDIVEGRSNISCNFPTGEMSNLIEVLAENYPRDEYEWDDRWQEAHEPSKKNFTAPPLPPWPDMRLENVLPEVIPSMIP